MRDEVVPTIHRSESTPSEGTFVAITALAFYLSLLTPHIVAHVNDVMSSHIKNKPVARKNVARSRLINPSENTQTHSAVILRKCSILPYN